MSEAALLVSIGAPSPYNAPPFPTIPAPTTAQPALFAYPKVPMPFQKRGLTTVLSLLFFCK